MTLAESAEAGSAFFCFFYLYTDRISQRAAAIRVNEKP